MNFNESIKNGVCAISLASLGMTACLGVTGCSSDNVGNINDEDISYSDTVESTNNEVNDYRDSNEEYYTCVWFIGENSAVLIPAYEYKMYRKSAITLYTSGRSIIINGDYIFFKTDDDITSYDMALAFAESVLGEDGKITNYADYIQEAKEKQKVKTLN